MSVPAAASTSRARGPPSDGDRPLLGHARAEDLEVGPLHLEPLLEPVEHDRGAAGGRRDEVPVIGQAHRDAVVERPSRRARASARTGSTRRRGSTSGSCTCGRGRRRRRRRRPRSCRACSRRASRPRSGAPRTRARRPRRGARRRAGSAKRGATARRPRTRAPCATCHACIGVVRTGSSSRGPVSRPASAENGTGTYGGRAFVGPWAPGPQPTSAFTISAVRTPLVRPWSIVVPM